MWGWGYSIGRERGWGKEKRKPSEENIIKRQTNLFIFDPKNPG